MSNFPLIVVDGIFEPTFLCTFDFQSAAAESQGRKFDSCQWVSSCFFANCSWFGLNVYKINFRQFHLRKPILCLFYEHDAQNLDINHQPNLKLFILTGKSCQDPGTPWRGSKKGNLQVGQTLHFSCNQCYRLRGSNTMTCQSDLKWSGRRPTCTGELHGFSFVFLVLSFQFPATFHFSAEPLP